MQALGFEMEVLGRGHFAVVRKSGERAVKTIYTDDQVAPHSWRAELAALEQIDSERVVKALAVQEKLELMEPYVAITFPLYAYTLESVIFHYAKANFPPNTGFRNAMPPARVAEIVGGIAQGLDAVHACGIIHRDVKPANIMFAEYTGAPVLIDFGVAYVPNTSREPVEEKITDVCTGEYKAPELLYGCRNYTEKIDVWSLGCILVQLLSPNTEPLFSPYTSDISLVAAQIAELGVPDLAECPSLRGSVAESLHGQKSGAALAAAAAKNSELGELLRDMLQYEWTRRPSARDVGARCAEVR